MFILRKLNRKEILKKAKIISGPDIQQIWMWGMISNFRYKVIVDNRVIQLDAQIQKLRPVPGTGFRQYDFNGYDEFTGRRISGKQISCDPLLD